MTPKTNVEDTSNPDKNKDVPAGGAPAAMDGPPDDYNRFFEYGWFHVVDHSQAEGEPIDFLEGFSDEELAKDGITR